MDIRKLSGQYRVRTLGDGDVDAIFALSAGNPMFYEYCPPFVTRESILADQKALPPRTTYDDKFYVGFFCGETLVAVLDLILNYPNQQTVFIGLFMLDRQFQGRGIGSEIVQGCFRYLKTLGYAYVRLGFAKGNPQSEAFWMKNGFQKTGVQSVQENYTMVVMQKEL